MALLDPVTMLYAAGVFFRAGTFFFLLPFLGRPVPIVVRLSLAVFLAYSAILLVPAAEELVMFDHWSGFIAFVLVESFLGFCMALGVLVLFHIIQTAGELISSQMGLMQSNILNPMSGTQESVLGTGLMMLTLVMIFLLNIHHEIFYGFIQSLRISPVGIIPAQARNIEFVLYETGKIFLISIQMAGPIIAVNYIITLSFAFLGKIIPTMNVLILSFSLRLTIGFFILILVFYMLAQVMLRQISLAPERMLQFLPF
jgi:flagellar biosynthetic protein FliR